MVTGLGTGGDYCDELEGIYAVMSAVALNSAQLVSGYGKKNTVQIILIYLLCTYSILVNMV